MKSLSSFVNSILAGICISIGGTVFLSLDNKVLGSLLFAVGLFTICTFGFNLFTGKVAYIFDNKPSYALWTLTVWLGNLVGCLLVGQLLGATRNGAGLTEKAAAICDIKLNDDLLSIFILAIFCNILIVIGVESFTKNPHPIGKYLGIIFAIMVFILSGYEHCVANMFYFTIGGVWTSKTVLYLVVMTLGNAVGGVIFPLCRKLLPKPAKAPAEKTPENVTAK